jgi:hypothetical protein
MLGMTPEHNAHYARQAIFASTTRRIGAREDSMPAPIRVHACNVNLAISPVITKTNASNVALDTFVSITLDTNAHQTNIPLFMILLLAMTVSLEAISAKIKVNVQCVSRAIFVQTHQNDFNVQI